MVARRPRFRFIPTLGVGASSDEAARVLGEGLGLPLLDEDDVHQAYGRGQLSLYVDTSGASSGLSGFTPMLGTDDLEEAIAHLEKTGCTTRPMPWAEDAPGVLVFGPSGLRFVVVPLTEVAELRARRFLDDSMEGQPVSLPTRNPPRGSIDDDPHRRPTRVVPMPLADPSDDDDDGAI